MIHSVPHNHMFENAPDSGRVEIPFLDLKGHLDGMKTEVEEAIAEVVSGGHYILGDGPEIPRRTMR